MAKIVLALCVWFLFSTCSSSLKPDTLFGKWKYIRVINPNSNPPDSIPANELAIQKPYIIFSKPNKLVILWGGKKLSSGTFWIDGKMIRFKENLPGGKTREFPFLVSELDSHSLVFETMTNDGTRVTARKERGWIGQ